MKGSAGQIQMPLARWVRQSRPGPGAAFRPANGRSRWDGASLTIVATTAVLGGIYAPLPGRELVIALTLIATSLVGLAGSARLSRTPATTLIAAAARLMALGTAALAGPGAAWAIVLIASVGELARPGRTWQVGRRMLRTVFVVQVTATGLALLVGGGLPIAFATLGWAIATVAVVALMPRLVPGGRPVPLPSARPASWRLRTSIFATGVGLTTTVAAIVHLPDLLLVVAVAVVAGSLALSRYVLAVREQAPVAPALHGLVRALDHREAGTSAHSRRVHDLVARMLAGVGPIGAEERNAIITAAMIHDVGKVATPDVALLKPGRLDPIERRLMQRHAEIGADILRQAGCARETVEIVRHHHERWDGAGYPDGVSGERIPLGSRLIAVADAWDAMTSDRVYRRALSQQDAMTELLAQRGSQFDPAIVDLFVTMVVPSITPVTVEDALAS